MTLTKEDLLAIKGIVDESVEDMKTDVKVLKTDVKELQTDVKVLKTDVEILKTDVKELQTDVKVLQTDVEILKTDVSELKDRVEKIEVVQLENYLIPKVEEMSAYQKSVYERYSNGADTFEDKIAIIDKLEEVTTEHSEQIKELQLKQA